MSGGSMAISGRSSSVNGNVGKCQGEASDS